MEKGFSEVITKIFSLPKNFDRSIFWNSLTRVFCGVTKQEVKPGSSFFTWKIHDNKRISNSTKVYGFELISSYWWIFYRGESEFRISLANENEAFLKGLWTEKRDG